MNADDVEEFIEALRQSRTDLSGLEAKRSHDGLPRSVRETLSAFSNTPGGGVLLLGVDESAGFAAVGVGDPGQVQSDLADMARIQMEPGLSPLISVVTCEGANLVVAEIPEIDRSQKPCFYKGAGMNNGSYIRIGDGDYRLGPAEVHQLVASRGQPVDDAQPVMAATVGDLDDAAVDSYIKRLQRTRPAAFRGLSREETLRRTRVLISVDGRVVPTVAGLIALGGYPQEFFPQLYVAYAEYPTDEGADLGTQTRFLDNRTIEGPIPVQVTETIAAITRSMRTRAVIEPDGGRRDIPTYPADAIREVVVNAIIHRDLGPHSLGTQVQVEVYPNRLVVRNPGGLFGPVSIRSLGEEGLSSSRNAVLLKILEDVEIPGEGRTVCENRASGIRTLVRSLEAAGLSPPAFRDGISSFQVSMANHTLMSEDNLRWLEGLGEPDLSESQRRALVLMRTGEIYDNERYRNELSLDSRLATRELQDLVARGLIEREGDKRWTIYKISQTRAERQLHIEGIDMSTLQPRPRPVRGDRREDVLEALTGGPRSRKELEELTGLNSRQINYALSRLVSEGRVSSDSKLRSPKTRYRLCASAS